ncbi:MAG: PqqD family protein [Sphingomicrobium sp.]
MADAQYRRAADVLEAAVGNELVALDVASGRCFGFNPVALSVWRSLAASKTFAELRDALVAEYDVDSEQCGKELQQLLEQLVASGLVERSD